MRKKSYSLRLLLLYGIGTLFLWLIIQGCDKSESSASIKGVVQVDGASGDSVVVRLYERPDENEDVSVWSIPAKKSSIAFPYQTQNVYDYRVQWQVRVDTTDAGGHFEFKDMDQGDYIVVADGGISNSGSSHYKENYGWSPQQDVHVDNSEVDVGVLQLYPDTVLGITIISTPITIPAGRHWVMHGDLIIRAGGVVTVEPGAVVRIESRGSIQVQAGGQLICNGLPDQFIIFTADEVVARDPAEWSKIRLFEGAEPPEFRYCRFEYAQTVIESDTEGGVIEYCFFKNSSEALRSSHVPPTFNRNVVRNMGLGVQCGSSSNVHITNNVFQTCTQFSIWLDAVNDGEIFCNWFRDGGGSDSSGSGSRGVLRLDWVSDFEIKQNSFETSWFALSIRSGIDSTVTIHHNNFHRMHSIFEVGITNDRLRYSQPVFEYNCMTTVDGYYAHIQNCHINNRDIRANNNYWNGIQSPQSLHSVYVWDCVRDQSCPCFLLEPVLTACGQIETLSGIPAGICEE